MCSLVANTHEAISLLLRLLAAFLGLGAGGAYTESRSAPDRGMPPRNSPVVTAAGGRRARGSGAGRKIPGNFREFSAKYLARGCARPCEGLQLNAGRTRVEHVRGCGALARGWARVPSPTRLRELRRAMHGLVRARGARAGRAGGLSRHGPCRRFEKVRCDSAPCCKAHTFA